MLTRPALTHKARQNMRTTQDSITELHMEAANADFVFLVVGFPNESKFVDSSLQDTQALKELNRLVNQGGHPLGFIAGTSEDGGMTIKPRPLAEYADDPVPSEVLRKLGRLFGEALRQKCN